MTLFDSDTQHTDIDPNSYTDPEVRARKLAASGHSGYWPWLNANERKANGVLMASVCLLIPFFFYAVYQSIGIFPSGRYPVLLLALPGIVVCSPLFLVVTWLVFRFAVDPRRRADVP